MQLAGGNYPGTMRSFVGALLLGLAAPAIADGRSIPSNRLAVPACAFGREHDDTLS